MNVDGQQGGGGVNVAQAKKEFNDLQRNLSRQSSLRRQKSRNSEKGQANFDPEKGGEQGEEFNLLEYLVSIFPDVASRRNRKDAEIWVALTTKKKVTKRPRKSSRLWFQVQGSRCILGRPFSCWSRRN